MAKRYLIKFIKERYLDDFLNNFLYMNAAGFFADEAIKNGQGDIYECPASNSYQIFQGRNYPIWCCSYIEEDEIKNGYISFDKRIISDFFDTNDSFCCVIIEEKQFAELFSKSAKDNYISVNSYEYGPVDYIKLSSDNKNDAIQMLSSKNKLEALFRKRSDYAYQKEYRIAFGYSVYRNGEFYPYKYTMHGIGNIAKVVKEYVCDSEKVYIKFV